MQRFHDSVLTALEASEVRLNNLRAEQIELELAAGQRMSAKAVAEPDHTGQFHFAGAVHETSVHHLIKQIDSYARRYPKGEIEILLNSSGGSVVDGFALIDYLRRLQSQGTKVRIVGLGLVASMAGIILMTADDRVMTKRAWLGMHEISQVISGSITIAEDTMKFSKALQAQAVELLCERSTLTPQKLKNLWARKDVFIDASEALKLGLIDRIEGD